MTSSSPKHLSKLDSILWFWTKTGGKQFAAHCLRGAVIGRLEERWVQQGKPRLACRSFYLNQEKKSVLSTKPWSFWAEVLLDSPDHVQAPSCWQNQLTMALNWTYRAFFRELAHARGATSEVSVLLIFIICRCPLYRAIYRAWKSLGNWFDDSFFDCINNATDSFKWFLHTK